MTPDVVKVEPLAGYRLKIFFANNEVKEFDVSPYLDKGIFKELKDKTYFSKIRVAFGSVEWPNSQDLSKDTLYLLGTEYCS
ncbi:DUF2442 domain-containing protein [Porticoccus sp. W117]|uniref:DUF2442 domain-containing protein n=1 Tax=Porticoccus sp. W117 TaxID=3054777 RepID=UPI002594FDA1|nr:DUF2442 domain-containing protein [Porticoccus sp. W117]MDM3871115.1 DUF2442 domain-containing protein [Porticoccus sp. W117]